MIKEISIKEIATYDNAGVVFNELKKVNFLYGSNGSGKTTLSNVIKNFESLPACNIDWVSQPLKTLVYNQKFVEENFHQDSNIKGIFTLGKESTEIRNEIAEKKRLVDKLDEEIRRMRTNLTNKEEEYTSNENEFIGDCWELKRKYDNEFLQAFSGVRNNKINFMNKCKQSHSIDGILYDVENLRARSIKLFNGSLVKIPTILPVNNDELNVTCASQIFKNQIVGKQEIDIAAFISRLAISDWVKRGYDHVHNSEGKCPFCQQSLPDDFLYQLEEYFNETYENEMKKLKQCVDQYMELYSTLKTSIQDLLEKELPYIDKENINQQFELIRSKNETNLELIEQKQNEPSKGMTLVPVDEFVKNINLEIERVNQEIHGHNKLIDNRTQEEQLLKDQIWRFIANENLHNHEKYVRKEYSIINAIRGIKDRITSKTSEKNRLISDVEGLEAQITSVIPSVNEMNRLLKAYNFTNFKFAHTQTQGNYRLVRSTGEDVNQTLSEGEKTFVTFLYFMHLLNGSNNRDLITENKVVVIDDPISSLDSNVLFIVSNLILKLIDDSRNNKNNVVQIFVLTHNVYFHKEVTFHKKRSKGGKLHDETFWIIRKVNNITEARPYDTNPIKTSYELMWQELRSATQSSSSTTVQNLIRRIIENYFKVFGNFSEDDILNKFDEEEKIICKSLLSWANDGSHFASDDLYIEHPIDTNAMYLNIFEKIFKVTNHHAHYTMMMGSEVGNEIPQAEVS
ncbi:AAA family ATPase [Paenibacillus taichungensis]|uniref:AAA family ATPase n=1 Tax=Paenibacillus taichungensis TaxID=484184 RepID=UPI0028718685|nr:AAA family ATPase [Paenibacillus taichungensis]MDR9744408.1 AAA family ATPase [Paenibacillus taichungensis]